MIRKAKAIWHGTGRAGDGNLTTDSGVLDNTPYSFKTRFENEKGTNPEELIAAAHAGCFTMALAFQLQGAGFTPTELVTDAAVSLDPEGQGFRISRSALTLRAKVPNLDQATFDRLAGDAPGFHSAQCRDHARRQARLSRRRHRQRLFLAVGLGLGLHLRELAGELLYFRFERGDLGAGLRKIAIGDCAFVVHFTVELDQRLLQIVDIGLQAGGATLHLLLGRANFHPADILSDSGRDRYYEQCCKGKRQERLSLRPGPP